MSAIGVIDSFTSSVPLQREVKTSLSTTDFYNLIIEGLKNQDPSKAQDTTQLLQQYTTLANFQSAQSNTSGMESLTKQQTRLFARDIVGSNVEVLDPRTKQIVAGVVGKVTIDNSIVRFMLNGTEYTSNDIQAILPQTTQQQTINLF